MHHVFAIFASSEPALFTKRAVLCVVLYEIPHPKGSFALHPIIRNQISKIPSSEHSSSIMKRLSNNLTVAKETRWPLYTSHHCSQASQLVAQYVRPGRWHGRRDSDAFYTECTHTNMHMYYKSTMNGVTRTLAVRPIRKHNHTKQTLLRSNTRSSTPALFLLDTLQLQLFCSVVTPRED